jgi:Pyruvate/2-oxoacid:ferredoxin oxidoreductase delta subunit
MDAIIAMEGNGPRNGKPRQMNALLFSTDPVALDAVACRLIDLNPEFVPTSRPGEASGLGTYRLENIDAVGEDVESFRASDFQVVREPPVPSSEGRIRRLIRDAVTARPVIDKTECSACGTCIDICPAGNSALDWMSTGAGKRPRHDYSHCIRCYCCQEICPEGAIALKVPILGRLLFRARKNGLSGDSAKGG